MRGLQRREIDQKEAERLAARMQAEWEGCLTGTQGQGFPQETPIQAEMNKT